ncbi:MAG: 4Fe-4S binding protein [Dehalococcoidales bacterium]|nr:4Fe-4S binding protein [Dehalococcoidales bacterium]
MTNDEVYLVAAEKLGYPGSAACIKYLRVLFTPEEGKLLLEFLEPATCAEVAKRLNMDEKVLQEKLDDFKRRRLLFWGKKQYVFRFGIHVFFARIPHAKPEYIPKGFWDAWREFHPEEIERFQMGDAERLDSPDAPRVPPNRIIPYRLALAASPKVKPDDILWYEDIAQIFAREEQIGIVECPCRKEFHKCDRPLMTCYYFSKHTLERDINEHSAMKKISLEEAIHYSDEIEKGGLMHLMPNYAGYPDYVMCNCCDDCCVVLGPAIRSGRLRQLYAPSRYVATVDTDKCSGCQQCIKRCFFNAIEMRLTTSSKKKKAHILRDFCMGCGSCIVGCKQNALTFELVRPPEHIPAKPQPMNLAVHGVNIVREETLG